jgi:hypothetical protein
MGVFDKLSFVVHRNGEADVCGLAPSSMKAIQDALYTLNCEYDLDKYQMETFLTALWQSDFLRMIVARLTMDLPLKAFFTFVTWGRNEQ